MAGGLDPAGKGRGGAKPNGYALPAPACAGMGCLSQHVTGGPPFMTMACSANYGLT